MIQGTTPRHVFKLPFDASMVEECRITYAQAGEIMLTKETEQCSLDGNEISIDLTQEETFKFDNDLSVEIQLRVLTKGGQAMASKVWAVDLDRCLDKEVLA